MGSGLEEVDLINGRAALAHRPLRGPFLRILSRGSIIFEDSTPRYAKARSPSRAGFARCNLDGQTAGWFLLHSAAEVANRQKILDNVYIGNPYRHEIWGEP